MLFPKPQSHLFKACAILALFLAPYVLIGQVSLYSEDFESETPVNTEDLCDPAYFPTDGNWALGPACSVPTNGIPKLVDVSGDAVLEFNQKYPEDSEVWNSADIDVTGVSNAIVSFDARSVGGFENQGPFVDDFAIYIVRDGEQDLTPLVSFSGHVDGTGNGTNQTVTASFSEAIDVAGDSEISLRILVGISGSDGSESYQLNNISICNDSNADAACTVCDEPIVLVNGAGAPFSTADSTVACISDLPQTCASDVAANRGSVTCAAFRSPLESTTCIATSAEGIGEDGAIVLVGAGDDGSDLFFEPSPQGLELTQTTDGEAWVVGQVQSVDDPLAILNVSIKYSNGITGSEWRALNGPLAFKNDQGCPVTTAIEDSWLMYLMSTSTISFLTGEGNLAGTSLVLSHQPSNGYFAFQVGEMANNKSCNFGAGAWFSYEGTFNGVEVQSGFGDLLLDISCSTGDNNPCPTDDSEASLADALNTTLVYTVVDPSCPLDPIAEFTQVVSRLDTVAPTLIGVPNDTTVTCFDQIPALPVVTATDNCDAVTPIYSGGIANADSVGPGCYSVTNQWFVMDSCSNQTIATQTITVSDTLKPTIDLSCPSDTMIYVGASCDIDLTVANTGDITVNFADNCALATSGSTHNDVVTDSTSTGCYTIERTWTASATDACGNDSTTTCMQTIMVKDNTKPTIDLTCPADTIVYVDIDCSVDLTTTSTGDITVSYDDNCELATSGSTHNDEVTDSTSTGCYTIERTWTASATDACGNDSTTTCMQTIMVKDNTKPTIDLTCPADTIVYVDIDCSVDLTTTSTGDITVVYDDNCELETSGSTHNDVVTDSTSTGCYTIERTWTASATDACGNDSTTTCTQTIMVKDNIKPSIDLTCPSDTILYADAGCSTDLSLSSTGDAAVSFSDNCLFTSSIDYSDDVTDSTSTGCYTIERTWTASATDACGNDSTTTCTQTIEVKDNTKPTIDLTCPADTVMYVNADCYVDLATSSTGDITVDYDDNCVLASSGETFNDVVSDSTGTGCYTIERTWTATATDACGNDSTTTCMQTIEVADTLAPEWDEFVIYQFVSCDDILDPTDPTLVPITATDNCSGVRYEIEAHELSGGCPGTWMRLWTAIDSCGNSSIEVQQYLQQWDSLAPVLTLNCPTDISLEVDASCEAGTDTSITGTPSFSVIDNCDSEPTYAITYSDDDTTSLCGNTYQFVRTWQLVAEDVCENKDTLTCDQTITLVDSIAPMVNAAADTTVECDGMGNEAAILSWLANNGGASASDNCSDVTWSNNYTVCPDGSAAFNTFRQGTWGSSNSNTASDLLATDFASVFPSGLTAGCGANFKLDFTNAAAIENYLPCTGTAQDLVLSHSGPNPTSESDPTCWNNALVSHLITAKLNVGFDLSNPALSPSDVALGDLLILEGVFFGKSVNELIEISDGVLGDCRDDYSPQQCRVALRAFNKNYAPASTDRGFVNVAGCLSDDCGSTGIALVTFTATDDCNNTSTTTATFTIEDTTNPTLTADASINLYCADWDCDIDVLTAAGAVSGEDICSDVTLAVDSCKELSFGCLGGYEVYYSATDDCGNQAFTTQIVSITDSIAPVITVAAQDTTTECDGSGNTDDLNAWLANYGGASAFDECEGSDLDWSNNFAALNDSCGSTGAVTVTFTVKDCNNNSSTTTATFIIEDTTDPTITVEAANDTVECDGAGNTAELTAWLADNGGADATDACSGPVIWTHNFIALSDSCGATGESDVTFTATDSCGNFSTTMARFVIEDTTAPDMPTMTCPSDTMVYLDANCAVDTMTSALGMATATSSDLCDANPTIDITYVDSEATYTCSTAGQPVVNNGFLGQYAEGNWLVNNNGTNGYATFEGDGSGLSVTGADIGNTDSGSNTGVTKVCIVASELISVSFDWYWSTQDWGSYWDPGFYINDTRYNLTNGSNLGCCLIGPDEGGSLTFQVQPGDLLGFGVESIDGIYGSATLEISNFAVVGSALQQGDATAEGSYSFTRTWSSTATDDCGLTSTAATCSQLITVLDTIAPVLTAAADTTVECDGSGNTTDLNAWLANYGGATGTDNCDSDISWTNDYDASNFADSCGVTGTVMVTFTAADDCNNSSTTTATFIIEDTTDPTITVVAENDTVECDGAGNTAELTAWLADNGGANATDACSGPVIWTNNYVALSDLCAATGESDVTFTATDSCGNASTTMARFVIEDTTAPDAPTITCPNDTVIYLDANCAVDTTSGTLGLASSTASDVCDSDPTLDEYYDDSALTYTCTGDDADKQGSYSFTRTFYSAATDACGLTGDTSNCVQTITVLDTLAPVLTAAMDTTVECDGSGNTADLSAWLANYGGATGTDNCDSELGWTNNYDASNFADSCGVTGTVSVTFTAADDCNNTSTTTATFIIEDTTDPTITVVAANDTVECDGAGNAAELAAWLADNGGAEATDACSGPVIWTNNYVALSDLCAATGESDVTFTATDSCGNASTTMARFVIEDTTAPDAPTITCPNDTVIYLDANCAVDTTSGTLGLASSTASDVCDSDPTLDEYYDDSALTYTCTGDDADKQGSYTFTRTFYSAATDACGLTGDTSNCVQTITVLDSLAPTITRDSIYTISCEFYDAATLYAVSALDNCDSDVTITIDSSTEQSGTCPATYLRVYKAIDDCGNYSTMEQVVNVIDTVAPELTISCPSDTILFLDATCGADTTTTALGDASTTLSDNCDDTPSLEVTYSDAVTAGCGSEYTVVRTWTAVAQDTCNNTSTEVCVQNITVLDTIAPTIALLCPGDYMVEVDDNCDADLDPESYAQPAFEAADNCDLDSASIDYADVVIDSTSLGCYTIKRTWTAVAIDACDNLTTDTCSQVITVKDITKPELMVTGSDTIRLYSDASCFADTAYSTILGLDWDVSDNCTLDTLILEYTDSQAVLTCPDTDSVLEGSYSFTREFTLTASDECGNDSTVVYEQVIEVHDTLSPQFTGTCGFTNGGTEYLCCTSLDGELDWETTLECEVTVIDNCDSEVSVSHSDVFEGDYAPTDEVVSFCQSIIPEAFESGETCTGHDPHNLRLFSLPGIGTEMYADVTGSGLIANNVDGTWSLTQEVMSIDGTGGGWIIEATYSVAMDWNEWTGQPGAHTFKLDCGNIGDDHENWDYRVLNEGMLIGTGTYAGDTLQAFHAPSNELFGLQVGLGGSGQNANYGYGAWIYYSGQFQGVQINGTGDIFGDLDCCLPWSVTRTYTAEDDCENASAFSYTLSMNDDENCDDNDGAAQVGGSATGDHSPAVIGGAGDLTTGKTPIRVTNLQPNPTNDWSLLGFSVTENMRLRVDMVAMDGTLIAELYDGIAAPNVNHTLDIEANDLDAGMYQIRLSSAQYLVVKKLLVSQ